MNKVCGSADAQGRTCGALPCGLPKLADSMQARPAEMACRGWLTACGRTPGHAIFILVLWAYSTPQGLALQVVGGMTTHPTSGRSRVQDLCPHASLPRLSTCRAPSQSRLMRAAHTPRLEQFYEHPAQLTLPSRCAVRGFSGVDGL